MSYSEFYCDPAASDNLGSGHTTGAALVTSTNGDWGNAAANRFTAASGTPFSGLSGNGTEFASIYLDGAAEAVYIGRITAVNAGGASIDISSTAKSGTAPTTGATGRTCKVGGAWKGPNGVTWFPFNLVAGAMVNSSLDYTRVNFKTGTYAMAEGTPLTSVTGTASSDLLTTAGTAPETGTAFRIAFASGFGGLFTYAANTAGSAGGEYFSIKVSATTFKAATTHANAVAGTAIDITSDGTGATVTPMPSGPTNSNAGPVIWEGYTTTPGDGTLAMTLPNITGDATDLPFTGVTFNGTGHKLRYIQGSLNGDQDGGTTPNAHGDYFLRTASGGTVCTAYRCKGLSTWRNFLQGFFRVTECEAANCNTNAGNTYAGFNTSTTTYYLRCWAHHMYRAGDAGDPGFAFQAGTGNHVTYDSCISSHNGGQGWWCVTGAQVVTFKNCIAYANGLAGIEWAAGGGTSDAWVENCIFVNNGEAGLKYLNTTWNARGEHNAFFGNGTAVQLTSVTGANAGDSFSKTSHGLVTGALVYISGLSAGFTAGAYYVIRVDANTFQLASTLANAIAGTAVPITADGTGGVIKPQFTNGYAGNFLNSVALVGDPFTNGDAGDFSPNNTAGAGAACREAALAAFMIDPTITSAIAAAYSAASTGTGASIGAIIPEATGGGGSVVIGGAGTTTFN